jgi:hypothetical protein
MSESEITPSQAAWNAFADDLKRIGEKVTGVTGARNGRERAEGYRYLIRLISAAHQLELEADRRRPTLSRMMMPIRKFKGDGCDTLYHEAKVDENLEYRFEVTRGDDIFFSATVYAYDERQAYYIVDNLVDDKIVWSERDGRPYAEIHLSAERPEGVDNWVQLKGDKPILFTREYFPEFVHTTDEGRYQTAQLNIECLTDAGAPDHYTEEDLADGLKKIVDFVEDATDVSIGLSIFAGLNLIEYDKTQRGQKVDVTHITEGKMLLDEPRDDEHTPAELAQMIDPKLISNNLPGPGIQYLGAWFRLQDDEAILIEGKDVPCRYWSCQILTRYLESGDFRYHQVGLNNQQVKLRDDGSFVIYACHENPGVDNWVSTQGYENAHILIRTLLADPLMEASFSVIKVADIDPSAG